MSLTLFSAMNEWHEKIKIDFLLLLKFCIINKIIHGCLEIWNFSSPVHLLNTQREIPLSLRVHSLCLLVKVIPSKVCQDHVVQCLRGMFWCWCAFSLSASLSISYIPRLFSFVCFQFPNANFHFQGGK